MDIRECDDNELLEELANRGIDARAIQEFSMLELHPEKQRTEGLKCNKRRV